MSETKLCKQDLCKRAVFVKGYCKKHYRANGLDPCNTPEYHSWTAMKSRCYNQNNHAYSRYGGRGIEVCPSWKESYKTFLADMGNKPSPAHSLDRIDNEGNYEPSNCRWATPTEQTVNQRIRIDNKSGVKGVGFHKKTGKWSATVRGKWLGLFETKDKAIAARLSAQGELYE